MPDDGHAVLDAVAAVGYHTKVVLPECLLVRHERAVVGAHTVHVSVLEGLHEVIWREHVVVGRGGSESEESSNV